MSGIETFGLIPKQLKQSQMPFLCIRDYKITSQSGNPRGNDSIGTERGDYEWWFVLPNELMENTTHTWEEYESMATRLSQKIATLHHGASQMKQMGQNLTNISGKGGSNPAEWLERNAHMLTDTELANTLNYRVDSALMYKNSNRREITFSFQLADYFLDGGDITGYGSEYMYRAIRKLQELSCPASTGGVYRLEFPRIFEIETTGQEITENPMVWIKFAALTAVQPTWKNPYSGPTFDAIYPTQVDLQLTFKDMKPMFRHNFNTGGLVETS